MWRRDGIAGICRTEYRKRESYAKKEFQKSAYVSLGSDAGYKSRDL